MGASLTDFLVASRSLGEARVAGRILISDILGLISPAMSWATLSEEVRYTGEETFTEEGEILEAIYRGNTIYRFISTEEDQYGYAVEDAFYEDESLTTLIVKRHA